MRKKGTHTWDMHLAYHCCPECGKVFEDRHPFEYRSPGLYFKKINCQYCGKTFSVVKPCKLQIGPLIGQGEPAEVTWD